MRHDESGFTLIEVLVAVVILGLAAAATASSFRGTTNLLGENSLHEQAIGAAQAAVEDLRTIPFEKIESGTETSDDGLFLITTEVIDGSPEPGMKRIIVTTSWEWKGEARSYELQTIYSRLTKS